MCGSEKAGIVKKMMIERKRGGQKRVKKKTTKLQKEILIISRVLLFKNSASCTLL